jgi:hypothetical protein
MSGSIAQALIATCKIRPQKKRPTPKESGVGRALYRETVLEIG